MSNLENILNKILQEAEDKKTEILNKAKSEAKQIEKWTREKNERHYQDAIRRAKDQAQNILDRRVVTENVHVRDIVLTAKQEKIDEVFSLAKEDLKSFPAHQLEEMILSSLKKIEGEVVTVHLPKRYEESIHLQNIHVEWDEKIDSGYTIVGENIIYNYIFSDMVDAVREDMEGEIAELIFANKGV